MKNAYKKVRGFTIVEILVVLAIISLLSSIVMVSVGSARENAKIKTETATVAQFELYFKLYREQTNGYPPSVRGTHIDSCSFCSLRTSTYNYANAVAGWRVVADVLTPIYTPSPLYEDAWGNPYGYDNNYKVPGQPNYTMLCSMGPDEVLQTALSSTVTVPNPQAQGDDICIYLR